MIIRNVFKDMKKHILSGISYMIPVIVIGGFLTAMGRMAGNVDVEGTLGWALLTAGSAGFSMMVPVLTAGIAYSIAGKPGIAAGVVAGYLSAAVKAGFLGGLVSGVLIGIMILWMNEKMKVKALKSMMPIVILPVITAIVASLFVLLLIGPPLAAMTDGITSWFMGLNTSSRFLVGFMLGCMTGFDMGGPVNKIAFSVVSAFSAAGMWGPAAGKNAAAMAPPLGVALSALVFTPKKYTEEERKDAKLAILLSAAQVTEGALPFALKDPKRVIPAVTIGSGVAHGLILTWGVEVPVLHGGIFSIPLVNMPLLFIAALLIGATITGLTLSVLKPKEPVYSVEEEEEAELGEIEIMIAK